MAEDKFDGLTESLLSAARIESGLSLRQLAKKAGTSAATLSAYEHGRKTPSIRTVGRILEAAGMELRFSYAPIDPEVVARQRWEDSLPGIQEWRQHRDALIAQAAR
jgi:transcriptional regulator with XRE-family HTH domain